MRHESFGAAVVTVTVCLVLTMPACDSGNDAPTGNPPTTNGSAAPQVTDQAASLLDVLHLGNSAYLVYTTNNNGNVVDFNFIADGITWSDRNFTADHEGPYEPRVGVECERHITINGRVSDDGTSIEELTMDVETRGPSEGRIGTEHFMWKNIPVDSLYKTPASNWRDSPYMVYKLHLQRSEVADHVEGWTSSYQDSNTEPSPVDQEGRIRLTMPAEDATMSIAVSFSRK
jgi:hypothetical protein